MKIGSLFAGIGGFDLGFERAGFEVAWCAEWDRAAQAVLRTRFPRATVYGDIREIDLDALAPVDVICGGFPCQDLSVAGKRAGLAGARSGLFHDAMRIVRRVNPSVLILENVPGLLSSNHGLDFATVLREVGEGWDCAEVGWRVLDSQYFGVAQRRRRVFVVGGARAGCAESILALAEGGGGDPPSRGATREEASREAQGSSPAYGGNVSYPVTSKWHKGSGGPSGNECSNMVLECHVVVGTLDCNIPKQRVQNMMAGHWIPVAFRKSKRAQTDTDDETWVYDGLANTLNGFDTGDARTTHAIAQGVDVYNGVETGQVAATVTSATGGSNTSGPKVSNAMTVRRLTPTECERLQGFPDGWTQIGIDKPTADSPRYKQLGNAVTVNVAEWIARRVAAWMRAQDLR